MLMQHRNKNYVKNSSSSTSMCRQCVVQFNGIGKKHTQQRETLTYKGKCSQHGGGSIGRYCYCHCHFYTHRFFSIRSALSLAIFHWNHMVTCSHVHSMCMHEHRLGGKKIHLHLVVLSRSAEKKRASKKSAHTTLDYMNINVNHVASSTSNVCMTYIARNAMTPAHNLSTPIHRVTNSAATTAPNVNDEWTMEQANERTDETNQRTYVRIKIKKCGENIREQKKMCSFETTREQTGGFM